MTNGSRHDEARMIERIREQLDAGVNDLDDATLSRLAQARHRAVAAAGKPRRRWWAPWPRELPAGEWLVPAGAFASIVATAVALTIMVGEPGDGLARDVDDLEILTAGEEIELYENLEFYLWLQDRESTG